MKKHYALLQGGAGMRSLMGKFGLVIAALLPSVKAMSQVPVVTVSTPGACTTGNLTATSSIQPLSIAWTGPSSGTVNATWIASGTTVAGSSQGSSLNQLNNPNGLFLDGSGNLYVADFNNNRVIKFTPPFNPSNNGTIVAGTGTAGSANTQLNGPTAVYVDGSGNVFVCDQGNNRVMEWSSPYTSGTCVAGGNGFASGNTALAAPFGLYLDGSGNLYVGDKSNNRVQKFTAAQIASATAGQTSASVSGTTVLGGNGTGSGTTQLNIPSGVFIDAGGNLYVADYNNNRIQKITAAQIASATAGQTSSSAIATTAAGGNGAGTAANQLNHPNSVFLDCANNIYVADYSNNRIQQWLSGSGSGSTVAGSSSGTSGSSSSLLNLPSDVVVDANGNLFVTDYNNSRVQEFTPTIVYTFPYTLPGTYTATVTTFTCATGNNNATATTGPAISTQPVATTVCAGSSASFSVVAPTTNPIYQWYENGISLGAGGGAYSGTQTANLVINPTSAAMNGNTYSVQVTSGTCAGTVTSSTVTLTVNSAASIIGNPPTSQSTCVGSSASLSVFATGTNLTYLWQVNPPAGFGNVSNGVNYSGATTNTLSFINTPAGFNGNQYRVIVNSSACPGAVTSTTTAFTVNPLPVINSPQPFSVTVCSGGNATYQVSASGTSLSYQWQYSTLGSSGPWTNQTNITPFTGANTPTLNLVGVTTAMNGYYYQCVVTSGAGCIATTTPALLTVNPIPTITPGVIPAICAGVTSVQLNYTGVTGAPTTYSINTWSGGTFANVTNAGFTNPNPITIAVPGSTTAGSYTANFFVTNAGGCSSPGQNITVNVNALPTITLGANPTMCFNASNTSVNLPYSALSGQSPFTYTTTWSSGPTPVTNGALAAAPGNINIAVPGGLAASTYTGSLTVTDGNGCTSNPASAISLLINPLPTITLTNGGNTSQCSGNTVGTLAYTATTATQYSITWNAAALGAGFNNVGTTSMPGSSPISFAVPGVAPAATYTGTLTLTSAAGCTNTYTITDTVNVNPTISLGANPAVCYGTTSTSISYTTTNSPANYSITWSGAATAAGFTNTAITALPGSPITIAVPGTGTPATYTGTLTVYTASGCPNGSGSVFTVTINPIPSIVPGTVSAGINAVICAGSTPAVLNYSGAFGSPNQYSITAWGSSSIGFATVSNQALGASINIAIPLSAVAGLDTASLTVTNAATGCTSPAMQIVVKVNGLPTISLGSNPAACQGVTADTLGYTVTNGNPITYSINYTGAPGNGFTNVGSTALTSSPLPITVPAAAAAGTYNGTITVTDANNCSSSDLFHVIVYPTPSITMGAAPSICSLQTSVNYPYTNTTGGTISTYTINWNPAASAQGFVDVIGSSFVASPIPVLVPANAVPGTYTGTIYVTNANGCTSTGTAVNITVLPLPSVTLGANPAVCSGVTSTSITYNTPLNGPTQYAISWGVAAQGQGFTTSNGTLSGGTIPITVPAAAAAATYNGTILVNNASCTSLPIPFHVTINPLPTITLGTTSQAVCFGTSSVNFPYSATTNNPTTYTINGWSGGGFANQIAVGLASPPSQITVNIPGTTVPGTYTANLTVNNGCTSIVQVITIIINPLPTITLGANPAVCTGTTLANLTYSATTNTPNQYGITWSAGAGAAGFGNVTGATLPSSPIPITVPGAAAAGPYTGTLTVTNTTTGCTSNNYTITVTLDQKPVMPVISPSPDTVCAGLPIQLIGKTSSSGTPFINYTWVTPTSAYIPPSGNPNVQTGAAPNGNHNHGTGVFDTLKFNPNLADVSETGIYKLTASITYVGGVTCVSDTARDTVYIIPAPPTPNPTSNSPLCAGQCLHLFGNVTLGPGVTVAWSGPTCSLPVNATTVNDTICNVNTCDSGDFIFYTQISLGSFTCFSTASQTHVSINPLPSNPTTNIDLPNHSITVCQNALLFIQGNSPFNSLGIPSYVWNPTPFCYAGGTPYFNQNVNVSNTPLCDSGMYVLNTSYTYLRQGVNLTCYSAIPDTVYVHVNPLPPTPLTASVNSPVCLGDSLHFTATNNPALCPTCYSWTGHVNGTSPFNIGNTVIADTGIYTVHSTSTLNGVTCQSATGLTVHVSVKPLPVTPNIASNSPVCKGDTLRVSAIDTQHNVTYIWVPDNYDTSYLTNPAIPGYGPGQSGINHLDTVTTPNLVVNHALLIDSGLYNVYAVLNGCKSGLPASIHVTINDRPNIPGDSSNSPICQNGILHLYAYDTITNPLGGPPTLATVNYSWTGPNGFTSTQQNPNFPSAPLTDSGNYCVTTSANGCPSVQAVCTHVSIRPIPANPLASNNAPVCSGAPNVLQLCADSTTPGITYLWSGPIVLTAYGPTNRCLTIPAPNAGMSGLYSVYSVLTYYYVKNGVTDTLSCKSAVQGITNVVVNTTPAPPTVANITLCQNDPVTQLSAGGTNLLWYTTQTGGIGSAVAPTPYDSLPGVTYWYVSQTSANGCTSPRSSLSVTVIQQSQAPYVPNGTVTYCQGDIASPLNVVGVTLRWYTTPTGGIGSFITPTPSTSTPGTTIWYVTQTTNGCESPRVPISVIVKQKPQPPIVANATYCQNETAVPLTAIGQNLLWYTTPVGGFGATTGPTPSTQVPDTIIYYVTESFNGCESDRAKQYVYVLYTPNAVIVPNQPYVCEDSTMSFKYFGSALTNASYDWGLPAGSVWDSGRGAGPIWVTFDTPGHKVITLIVSNGRCKSPMATYTVDVRPMPVQTIGSLHEVCQDDIMIVGLGSVTPGVSSYRWDFDSTGALLANGLVDTGAAIISSAGPAGPFTIEWTTPGLHVIKVKAVLDNCPSGWTVDTVYVHPLPDARISNNVGIPCTNDSVQFSALLPNEDNLYYWSPEIFFVNGNSSYTVYGNVHYTSFVHLQVTTPFGCIAKDSLFVQTDSCCKVAFPNAFTPDGPNGYPDGLNDVFRPFIKEKGHHILKVFRIANRWGQTVFETTDEKHGWDGKLNGVKQEMDTYFWFIDYICSYNNVRYQERGECYLVR